MTPVLKIRGADVNVLSNFRPISNISFVAKTMERFAYRPCHSAEVLVLVLVLLRIHNAQSFDTRRGIRLVLLDLTAAFDTINHTILQRRLHGYGICGEERAWLTPYLHGCTSVVYANKEVSECNVIKSGVSQGSVLGPVLFNAAVCYTV